MVARLAMPLSVLALRLCRLWCINLHQQLSAREAIGKQAEYDTGRLVEAGSRASVCLGCYNMARSKVTLKIPRYSLLFRA